jgi:hypothetical protein
MERLERKPKPMYDGFPPIMVEHDAGTWEHSVGNVEKNPHGDNRKARRRWAKEQRIKRKGQWNTSATN